LSVDLGNLNGGYDNAGTAGLLIGGSQYVPATGTDATSGNWTTWTAVFTGTPGTQGDSITIDLRAVIDVPPVQSDFDKVGLTASTAPPNQASTVFLRWD
jgi:hypothetical protein